MKEDLIASLGLHVTEVKVAISTDASCEVHVFLLDGDTLGVDGTQVSVFEKTGDVGFRCLLEGLESLGLETQAVVELHSDATDETLE